MKVAFDAHPAALLFPLMAEGELSELAEDIRAHGLIDPIVCCDGLILDGRNRLEACRIAGVEARFEECADDSVSPFEYVIAKNLHRRHLTTAQRAALALELLPHLEEEAKERQGLRSDLHPSENGERFGEATKKAAELVGVGRSTVAQAKAIQTRDPAIIDEMRAGNMPIAEAARRAGFQEHSRGRNEEAVPGKRDVTGRKQPEVFYGKGDKWAEAVEPLRRYLAAWRKRGFEYRHINPNEAIKRVETIDRLIADLQDARADLAPRSHKAKLTV